MCATATHNVQKCYRHRVICETPDPPLLAEKPIGRVVVVATGAAMIVGGLETATRLRRATRKFDSCPPRASRLPIRGTPRRARSRARWRPGAADRAEMISDRPTLRSHRGGRAIPGPRARAATRAGCGRRARLQTASARVRPPASRLLVGRRATQALYAAPSSSYRATGPSGSRCSPRAGPAPTRRRPNPAQPPTVRRTITRR